MKVIKLEQNTEEWLEFRKGKSGGSEFKDLWSADYPLKSKIIEYLEKEHPLSPADKRLKVEDLADMLEPSELAMLKIDQTPKPRYYRMIAERVARPITPNDYTDRLDGQPFSMMARGHILEPEALEAFEQKTGKKLDEDSVVWVSDWDENIYISPDGTITDKDGKVREAVEVKCLDSHKVVEAYLTKHIPSEYKPQIVKYFVVNEDLETLYFVIYTDVIPGLELQIFEIKRDEVAQRVNEAKTFEQIIMKSLDRDVKKIERLGF